MAEIEIRPANPDDADALLEIYAPYVQKTAITFEYDVPSEAEFGRRIAKTLERYPYLVVEQDGGAVGYAYVGPFHARPAYDWSVETSIYVAENERRSGLGAALHAALERALCKQGILNMEACIAFIQPEDEYLTADSVRFHERMGYRMVGRFEKCGYKFGRWYDMVWMEKLIGEHCRPQAPVSRFDPLNWK